ncbi:MAG: sodium:solute symporter family protein [Clostridia bacterium]|nr:sodium:solute symporter family protein [Clostridia bacterium]
MWDQVIVFGYLAVLVIVGLRGGGKIKNAADFTATGKRCGTAVVFATLSASFIGGGYSSGNAAAAYESGIGTALALFGFGIGMILIGKFLVPGVARFPHAKTVGGILGNVYGSRARFVTGLFSFLCCAGVVGAQMESIGLVFHTLLGVPKTAGIIIGCSVVLLYTTFGGMESVLTADMIQFFLLALGMPLLLLIAVIAGGGPAATWRAIPAELLDPLNQTTLPAFLSLFLSMMCGEALAPPYMQRLLIGKTPRETARGTMLSGAFSLPFFLVTAGVGLSARALGIEGDPATVMPDLILRILPIGLRGLLMAAMVSIILSAADGFLNGAAVSLVCDTILPRRPMADRAQLHCLRTVNLLTGLAAMALAFLVPNVFSILLLAYSFWSPALLIPLAAALLGVRADERTFFRALISGVSVCLLWNHVLCRPLGIDGTAVGTLANFVVFTISHFVTEKPLDKAPKAVYSPLKE